MPHGDTGVVHLGESSTPEAVGTNPLQAHTVAGLPENFVSAGLMNMPSKVPPRKQIFLIDGWLVSFQVAFKFGVNLDFPRVLLALGVDAADENLVSNPLNPHHVSREQGTSFIDAAGCVEADPEQSPIPGEQ